MGTIADKLSKLEQTKSDIKQAIVDKGVEVDSTLPFAQYPSKIAEIKGGGGDVIGGINIPLVAATQITTDNIIGIKSRSTWEDLESITDLTSEYAIYGIRIQSVKISPNGKFLLITNSNKAPAIRVFHFDSARGLIKSEITIKNATEANSKIRYSNRTTINNNGDFAVAGSSSGGFCIGNYDSVSDTVVLTFPSDTLGSTSVSVDPILAKDGTTLLVCGGSSIMVFVKSGNKYLFGLNTSYSAYGAHYIPEKDIAILSPGRTSYPMKIIDLSPSSDFKPVDVTIPSTSIPTSSYLEGGMTFSPRGDMMVFGQNASSTPIVACHIYSVEKSGIVFGPSIAVDVKPPAALVSKGGSTLKISQDGNNLIVGGHGTNCIPLMYSYNSANRTLTKLPNCFKVGMTNCEVEINGNNAFAWVDHMTLGIQGYKAKRNLAAHGYDTLYAIEQDVNIVGLPTADANIGETTEIKIPEWGKVSNVIHQVE